MGRKRNLRSNREKVLPKPTPKLEIDRFRIKQKVGIRHDYGGSGPNSRGGGDEGEISRFFEGRRTRQETWLKGE